ncbi:MAG: homoserine O-acetyltransferase [Gemmatimonadaceae bacterium]
MSIANITANRPAPRVHRVPRFVLESGAILTDVEQAYQLDGELGAARDNVVLVFHALTGSADAVGDWWSGVAGPGKAIDTRRYAVLCANLLGSCYGTTGPRPGSGDAFPAITPRDMARLTALLVDSLGIASIALVTGGSLGGMVALEYALAEPGRARSLVALAAPAAHTAWAIAWNVIQRRALELGGDDGLALARMVGMMTYRTEQEFGARFGRRARDDGAYEAGAYLAHHGDALVRRFDAASYRVLTDAMDAHDIGRGRGGVDRALRAVRAAVAGPVVGVGVPGDNLYGADEVRRWTLGAGASYRELRSIHGHDAFLLEREQVGRILADTLHDVDALAAADSRLRELAS